MVPSAQADTILDAAAIPSVVREVVGDRASLERSPSGVPVRRKDDDPFQKESDTWSRCC
jgi:hypothetical protein